MRQPWWSLPRVLVPAGQRLQPAPAALRVWPVRGHARGACRPSLLHRVAGPVGPPGRAQAASLAEQVVGVAVAPRAAALSTGGAAPGLVPSQRRQGQLRL